MRYSEPQELIDAHRSSNMQVPRGQSGLTLQSLIHARLDFSLAQDIGKRQGATLKKMPPLTGASEGKA